MENMMKDLVSTFKILNDNELFFTTMDIQLLFVKNDKLFMPDCDLKKGKQALGIRNYGRYDLMYEMDRKFNHISKGTDEKTNDTALGLLLFQILCGDDIDLFKRRSINEWVEKMSSRYKVMLPSFLGFLMKAYELTEKSN
jgi:hypothetical protein